MTLFCDASGCLDGTERLIARRPPARPAGAAVSCESTDSRPTTRPPFFHRRIMVLRPAVNREDGGSIPPGGAETCIKRPCRTAAKFAGPSNQKRGFESPQGYQCHSGEPERLGYRQPAIAKAQLHNSFAGFIRSAGRSNWVIAYDESGSNPDGRREPATPGAHLARNLLCACGSAVERFPDEEEEDGSIPSTRTDEMPPFHGWDAALRTLTARVRVLPAVPGRLPR